MEISKIEDIKPYFNFLKNIKSGFNFKEIFSFLRKQKLLNLIIYNKHLQNTLNINIEDYKKISGKYKKGKKDGKVKIYKLNTNILIFEGEYIKGEKNGKGIEYYDNGKLKFKGKYLNGKRIGKGKEYDYRGKLEFEGEYLNGERNGKGKEYYDKDKIEFEDEYNDILEFKGEYLNDNRRDSRGYNINGNIEFQIGNENKEVKDYYNDDKLKFEGEYLNGERNGKGKEYYYKEDKLKFEGEYLNGNRWNGRGYNIKWEY